MCFHSWQFHVDRSLKPQKGGEKYFVAAEGDTEDFLREYVAIEECPACDDCSSQAWARACCYSYESYEKCQTYCLHHLMHSSLHKMKKEEAMTLMDLGLKWSKGMDTFDDREQYRKSLEGSKRSAEKPAKKLKVKKETDDAEEAEELAKLATIPNKSLAIALQMITIGGFDTLTHEIHERVTGALTSGSQRDILKIDAFERDIVVSSDQLKHLRDTLIRADASLVEAKRQMLVVSGNIHANQIAVREAVAAVDAMAYKGNVVS